MMGHGVVLGIVLALAIVVARLVVATTPEEVAAAVFLAIVELAVLLALGHARRLLAPLHTGYGALRSAVTRRDRRQNIVAGYDQAIARHQEYIRRRNLFSVGFEKLSDFIDAVTQRGYRDGLQARKARNLGLRGQHHA